jgi:hypothetical protein
MPTHEMVVTEAFTIDARDAAAWIGSAAQPDTKHAMHDMYMVYVILSLIDSLYSLQALAKCTTGLLVPPAATPGCGLRTS